MRIPLLIALLCAVLPVAVLADADEPTLMNEAQRAFSAGDYDTAKDLFTQVLQIDSHNVLAISYLRKIRLSEAGVAPTPEQKPIDSLILDKINFNNATFSSALDFLKHRAAEHSINVSFVVELPASQQDAKITLNLAEIPFLDALHYVCQMNNATYDVQQYAIVIKPAAAAPPSGDSTTENSTPGSQ
jgi:hypothetical protein